MLKKTKLIFLILMVSLAYVTSCTFNPHDGYKELGFLKIGMSLEDFVSSEYAEEEIDSYLYVEEEDLWEYTNIPNCGKISTFAYIFPVYTHTSSGTTYQNVYEFGAVILAFEDEKLIYWGYPEDFQRSENEKLRNIYNAFYEDFHTSLEERL